MSSCGSCKGPVYINPLADVYLTSSATGTIRTYVATPKSAWGLGLGLKSLLVGIRIMNKTTNFQVAINLQYSFDGVNWNTGNVAILAATGTLGDSKALSTAVSEFFPFVRVTLDVSASTGAAQEGALVSLWTAYNYTA